MKGFDDSSESEEDIRTVKSLKDKKLEIMKGMLKDLKNHIKINDFGSIMEDFDKLSDEIAKISIAIFDNGI